jgi:hypothetical protein
MAIQWAPILKAVFVEAIPALVDLIVEACTSGKADAKEMRNKSITVSISFGGGDGEAVKFQRTIEPKLPGDFVLDEASE